MAMDCEGAAWSGPQMGTLWEGEQVQVHGPIEGTCLPQLAFLRDGNCCSEGQEMKTEIKGRCRGKERHREEDKAECGKPVFFHPPPPLHPDTPTSACWLQVATRAEESTQSSCEPSKCSSQVCRMSALLPSRNNPSPSTGVQRQLPRRIRTAWSLSHIPQEHTLSASLSLSLSLFFPSLSLLPPPPSSCLLLQGERSHHSLTPSHTQLQR